MRKLILMTSAAVLAPMSAIAQTPTCTATPDCASLGYTEASCPNSGIKCPWGNTWACTKSCSEMGFKYTCTGTGYSGGSGTACEGKYTECTCASGYEWKNGSCSELPWGKCTGIAANCALGDILFSDGTCNANMVQEKAAIAVVVYKSGNCGQAMALNSMGSYEWGDDGIDIPDLTNYTSYDTGSKDSASCENSALIRAHGDSSAHPAVWAAHSYSTAGTKAGDWCLPAGAIFQSCLENKNLINSQFANAWGETLKDDERFWSSTEFSYSSAWDGSVGFNSYGINPVNSKKAPFYVRPVIEF